MIKRTISVLVKNQSGVLARVSGLFSRRGYNIESLAVGETHRPDISRMTIIVNCDDRTLDQIIQQLRKLYCVITVELLAPDSYISRELILIKVAVRPEARSDVMQIASVFRARVKDVSPNTLTMELTGDQSKNKAFVELLDEYDILEMVRTGAVALSRGAHTLSPPEDERL